MFSVLVYMSLFAVVAYAILYGFTSPWWETWIGRALLTKATGNSLVLGVIAMVQVFGPDYPGRETIRNTGMLIATAGFYMALFALIQVKWGDSIRAAYLRLKDARR